MRHKSNFEDLFYSLLSKTKIYLDNSYFLWYLTPKLRHSISSLLFPDSLVVVSSSCKLNTSDRNESVIALLYTLKIFLLHLLFFSLELLLIFRYQNYNQLKSLFLHSICYIFLSLALANPFISLCAYIDTVFFLFQSNFIIAKQSDLLIAKSRVGLEEKSGIKLQEIYRNSWTCPKKSNQVG